MRDSPGLQSPVPPTPRVLHQFLTCRIKLSDKLDLVNQIRNAVFSATSSTSAPPCSPIGSIPPPGRGRTQLRSL